MLLGALALVDQLEAPVADSHVPMNAGAGSVGVEATALEPLDPLPPHLLGVGPNDAGTWSIGNQGHGDPAAVLEGEELLVVRWSSPGRP